MPWETVAKIFAHKIIIFLRLSLGRPETDARLRASRKMHRKRVSPIMHRY
uniref:Uncharacterized protein n=1 Tax=Anguilla anguilla TaxID=7936 RepID=A0A0E9RXS0_ANGAN